MLRSSKRKKSLEPHQKEHVYGFKTGEVSRNRMNKRNTTKPNPEKGSGTVWRGVMLRIQIGKGLDNRMRIKDPTDLKSKSDQLLYGKEEIYRSKQRKRNA